MTQSEEYNYLKRLQKGEPEALDALYLHYAGKVRDFADRFLKNRTEADDITHDIFLQIWENRQQVAQALSFKAYLFRMTRNAIFNSFKHRHIVDRYESQQRTRSEAEQDDRVSVEDLIAMINLAIDQMPEQRRKIFRMSRFEEMSYNDIAQQLNISPKTVQYHISQALAELRKLMTSLLFFLM